MTIERIVRPAQTPEISPPKMQPVRRATTSFGLPITLYYGIGGDIKTMSGSYSASVSIYAIRRPKERQV